jgi:hypothetical protein
MAFSLFSEILPQLEQLISEVRLVLSQADQHPDFEND